MVMSGTPVIDMQMVDGLADEIVKACVEFGCFRVVNHGVSAELMTEMKAVVSSLFDLPEEIKRRTANPNEHGKGYIGRNHIDQLHFSRVLVLMKFRILINFLIVLVPPFTKVYLGVTVTFTYCHKLTNHSFVRPTDIINRYIKAIRDLNGLLGRKLIEGNGLNGDLFDGWCCQLRMNKYHFSAESIGLTCAPIHSDPTFLTILPDDECVNGLQLVDKISGEFVPFDPVPGTLAVNIGDIGKAWSNGRYYNVNHRVLCFEPNTRYSIALFVLGPNNKIVEAPSKLVDSEHPRLYVPIDVEKFRHVRNTMGLRTGDALDLFSTTST
ncbi:Non-heme dioxygenase N-terminal domain-containing protein [Artemisia annua]|uniref:Non-heme dioxygenase N-terminal domain-containing protein n=1 Tax=Artemisia annua TaxID=35608 RepID=A0A2U1P502_ARTAN|nr:Non-heme dioxygenase N-terminal domain-containing protein [Artemisia annua]